ncbi:hypothetical protein FACS1894147_09520 [Spirochaetia bacterium]|nr:hypothetical protein FACS1894147_09520 [Spirochaetia bacterium]
MQIHVFEETTMKYLLFLVHVQQSITLPDTEKIAVFDCAKKISNRVFSNVQSYLANKNEYNSYDKDKNLSAAFSGITKEIEHEFILYRNNITIKNVDFSYYKIIDTLTDGKYTVGLNRNEIRQLLSYNDLTSDTEKEKEQSKQLEDLREKDQKEFYELRKKAFLSMLRGNNNVKPMRFFEVNDYILRNARKGDIIYSHDPGITIKEGMYFIETRDEHIIKFKHDDRFIEYSFRVIDLDDGTFIMYIQGHIKINNQKEEFYINERHLNSQFKNVLYAYNLKPIIDLFNDLSMDDPDDDRDPNSSNDIDDFLSGKIE